MSHSQDTKLTAYWQTLLSDYVREVDAWVGSSQRSRKMSVEQLVQTLVLGCLEDGNASLRHLVKVASDLGCSISTVSLHERLTDGLVLVLMGVLQQAIRHQVAVKALPSEKLAAFDRLMIYDSTRISLPSVFAPIFADSTKGHSSLKIQLGFDYLAAQLAHLEWASGTSPDQTDAGVMAEAQAGTCLLLDGGYFTQEQLRAMDERGATFVIPLQPQTALYDPATGERIALDAVLKRQSGTFFEAVYLVGSKTRHALRVVARRLPTAVVEKKRRHARSRAKKAGYTPSQAHLTLLEWQILVTNLDASWTGEDVHLLYRVRWQVELVFKGWKTYLEVVPHGTARRRQRVFAQLLANLIGAVLCQTTFALVRWSNGKEVTWFGAITTLKRELPHLYRVIRRHWYGLQSWVKRTRQKLLREATRSSVKTAPSALELVMNWGLT